MPHKAQISPIMMTAARRGEKGGIVVGGSWSDNFIGWGAGKRLERNAER
jgi:hypothetical protein